MKVSGQLHALAILSLGEVNLVPIGQEAGLIQDDINLMVQGGEEIA
jgi:hypothetical protein